MMQDCERDTYQYRRRTDRDIAIRNFSLVLIPHNVCQISLQSLAHTLGTLFFGAPPLPSDVAWYSHTLFILYF